MADAPTRSAHRLSTLFEPRSIALVGATERSMWSSFIIRNFRDFGFEGKVYAINRNAADVLGVKGYASCREIGEPVDVAFLFVPQPVVLSAMEDAAAAGIRNMVILTSGYAETGDAGAALQQALVDKAATLGVTFWGPNSLGFNNVSARAPVSSIPAVFPILEPRIAIVSQSGATASELNEFANSQNIGTSFVAATGNEGQLSLSDVIDYLVDHAPTRAIAIFSESIRDPETFARAAFRARQKRKPIVILKIGRSELATAVAKAHTGSLAGDDRVFDAVCARLGIIRVYSTEDLITTAGMLAATGLLPEPGLGFISISGGACTLVADGAESVGLLVPPPPPETAAALKSLMADFASAMNPLDVTGAVMGDPGMLERIIPVAAAAPQIGLVGINIAVPTSEDSAGLPHALTAIGRAVKGLAKPAVMVTTTAKSLTDITRAAIKEHDLPHVVCGIEAMLRAAAHAAWWSQELSKPAQHLNPALEQATPPPALSSERAVLDYLAEKGVPVIPAAVVGSRAEAEAAGIEGPLVLKILSQDIAHKTEVSGVRLNVASADVGAAYEALLEAVKAARPDARIEGVIVSPMRQGGVELLVGVTRDPTWGPMITVGFGGVLVELLADAAISPLPVTRENVVSMLERLRGAKLLKGFRNMPAADLDRLSDAIVHIGEAALALGPNLDSLEVNPLIARGGDVEALDGLVIWKDETR